MGSARVVVFAAACALLCAGAAGAGAATARAVGCPAAAGAHGLQQYGPAGKADVDGDGRIDRVWIAAAPDAPSSCGIFLVAHTAAGFAAVSVPGPVGGPARASLQDGLPRLFGLLRLGADAALEPVLIVDRGAQAVTFAVYRLAPGSLTRMRVQAASRDVLHWQDGATRLGSVDCAGPGLVRDSFAERRADGRWSLTRHTYRVGTRAFAAVRSSAAVVTGKPAPPAALPFSSCEGVRAG